MILLSHKKIYLAMLMWLFAASPALAVTVYQAAAFRTNQGVNADIFPCVPGSYFGLIDDAAIDFRGAYSSAEEAMRASSNSLIRCFDTANYRPGPRVGDLECGAYYSLDGSWQVWGDCRLRSVWEELVRYGWEGAAKLAWIPPAYFEPPYSYSGDPAGYWHNKIYFKAKKGRIETWPNPYNYEELNYRYRNVLVSGYEQDIPIFRSAVLDLKANGSDGPVTVTYGGSALLSWTSSPGFSSCSGSWGGSPGDTQKIRKD